MTQGDFVLLKMTRDLSLRDHAVVVAIYKAKTTKICHSELSQESEESRVNFPLSLREAKRRSNLHVK